MEHYRLYSCPQRTGADWVLSGVDANKRGTSGGHCLVFESVDYPLANLAFTLNNVCYLDLAPSGVAWEFARDIFSYHIPVVAGAYSG